MNAARLERFGGGFWAGEVPSVFREARQFRGAMQPFLDLLDPHPTLVSSYPRTATGHPDSSDSYDDGGQVIRFKCESHFDKRDRRMSDKISAEDFGVISEDWSTDFVEVISAAFSYKGGFRHLADSDEGDDRGEAKKIGGGGEGVASMPPTGPPTTFCLSDGNEWKVGEDLHLIVYPDAGPFKISFMDTHNLCKDTIHFEADDPHCPISECPVSVPPSWLFFSHHGRVELLSAKTLRPPKHVLSPTVPHTRKPPPAVFKIC